MKQVGQVLNNTESSKSGQREKLTDLQKEAVAYFFMRLKLIYANQYYQLMPDEETERLVKREYARQVCNITKERMDDGFEALHQQRQTDPKYLEFLNIDKVIGIIRTGGKHWSHRSVEAADRQWHEKQKQIEQKASEESLTRLSKTIEELRIGLK